MLLALHRGEVSIGTALMATLCELHILEVSLGEGGKH